MLSILEASILADKLGKLAFMLTYGQRLQHAITEKKSSRAAVAKAVGVSVQAVGQVIRGDTGAFTAENNAKAAKGLHINSHWLATGDGNMELADTSLAGSSHSPSSASATLTTGVASIAGGRVAMDLAAALQVVAYAAKSVDATARAHALDLIKLVVSNPEIHAEGQIPLIVKHLSGEPVAELPKRKPSSGKA